MKALKIYIINMQSVSMVTFKEEKVTFKTEILNLRKTIKNNEQTFINKLSKTYV